MIGIYKVTNKLNGKVYIGQSINIKQRWKQHRTNATVRKESLYLAFQKYGLENFSFEVLETCQEKELDEKEQYYISYYNSYNNGYNMTLGGQNNKVFYSDIICQLWDKGFNVTEICLELGLSRSSVYSRLKDYQNYQPLISNQRGGRQAYETMIKNGTLPVHMRPRAIVQYDIWGNKIKEWDSARQIKREIGIDNTLVGKVLKGEYYQAGGYQWKLIGDYPENLELKIPLKFGIIQKDKNENIVKSFSSLKEVKEELKKNPTSVSKCLKNKQKTAYGFIWEYDYSIWDGHFYEKGES